MAKVQNGGQRYKDRVVVVTGGALGIGRGVAQVFVQHGAKVVFSDINESEGQKTESDINATGPGECKFVLCNMKHENDIKDLIKFTQDTYGRIDCLVNNAGSHPPHKKIDDYTMEEFQSVIDLNLLGYFAASKYALPHLRKTQGSIINNSSLVGTIGQPQAVIYASTKGAIHSMTRALAIDEAEHNVRVNSFSPGNVWTHLWEAAAIASDNYDVVVQGGKDAQLVGRFGTAEECGLVCLFLAADATFCTGIDINVSGGAELDYGKKTKMGKPDSLYN